jgi:hypothetical protein
MDHVQIGRLYSRSRNMHGRSVGVMFWPSACVVSNVVRIVTGGHACNRRREDILFLVGQLFAHKTSLPYLKLLYFV